MQRFWQLPATVSTYKKKYKIVANHYLQYGYQALLNLNQIDKYPYALTHDEAGWQTNANYQWVKASPWDRLWVSLDQWGYFTEDGKLVPDQLIMVSWLRAYFGPHNLLALIINDNGGQAAHIYQFDWSRHQYQLLVISQTYTKIENEVFPRLQIVADRQILRLFICNDQHSVSYEEIVLAKTEMIVLSRRQQYSPLDMANGRVLDITDLNDHGIELNYDGTALILLQYHNFDNYVYYNLVTRQAREIAYPRYFIASDCWTRDGRIKYYSIDQDENSEHYDKLIEFGLMTINNDLIVVMTSNINVEQYHIESSFIATLSCRGEQYYSRQQLFYYNRTTNKTELLYLDYNKSELRILDLPKENLSSNSRVFCTTDYPKIILIYNKDNTLALIYDRFNPKLIDVYLDTDPEISELRAKYATLWQTYGTADSNVLQQLPTELMQQLSDTYLSQF